MRVEWKFFNECLVRTDIISIEYIAVVHCKKRAFKQISFIWIDSCFEYPSLYTNSFSFRMLIGTLNIEFYPSLSLIKKIPSIHRHGSRFCWLLPLSLPLSLFLFLHRTLLYDFPYRNMKNHSITYLIIGKCTILINCIDLRYFGTDWFAFENGFLFAFSE